MAVAYALCALLGLVGAHRFYLRERGTAVALLLVTLASVALMVSAVRRRQRVVLWCRPRRAPEVTVEEQGSESPRIAKLLRAASKSGAGQGRPDFIVQFRDEPELLAVIECKARTTAHESPTRQAHADYAVDGALKLRSPPQQTIRSARASRGSQGCSITQPLSTHGPSATGCPHASGTGLAGREAARRSPNG